MFYRILSYNIIIWLFYSVPPSKPILIGEESPMEFQQLELICIIRGCPTSEISISWLKRTNSVTGSVTEVEAIQSSSDSRYIVTTSESPPSSLDELPQKNSTLTIASASLSDSGEYICEAVLDGAGSPPVVGSLHVNVTQVPGEYH